MSAIEALYIFDEHNTLLFSHIYTGHPPPPAILVGLYLQQATPRPSLIYLPSLNPPTLCYSILQDHLLFLSPCSTTAEPLLVLEFLHRVGDALQEFLGSPLLANKITTSYDVVAQIIAEIADGGVVCQTEANALRDVVETGPGVLKNLLGSIGASGASPGLQAGGVGNGAMASSLRSPHLQPTQSSQGSAIPWRRSNVRHTSNELYVDFVESLAVTVAPSGRALSAFAQGSIIFTSKVSGIPDLVLSLQTDGKGAGMGTKGEQLQRVMERVVFHPCVRLNRWKSEGCLSFVPPDGRFALCGYEVDLLGSDAPLTVTDAKTKSGLNLPAMVDVTTGLGTNGTDFEVRVSQPLRSPATASLQSNLTGGKTRAGLLPGDAAKPNTFEDLTVHIPIPASVRNILDIRPSRGEAHWNAADGVMEWNIPPKEFDSSGAVLRCTVQGPLSEEDEDLSMGAVNGTTATTYDYDEDVPPTAKSGNESTSKRLTSTDVNDSLTDLHRQRTERNRELMPTSATLSFSMKGWLPSGIKVESLVVDTKKSRGLGADIKPYKGVKYLTVSQKGVEVRC